MNVLKKVVRWLTYLIITETQWICKCIYEPYEHQYTCMKIMQTDEGGLICMNVFENESESMKMHANCIIIDEHVWESMNMHGNHWQCMNTRDY